MTAVSSPARLWYQSFVDPMAQQPYIDRLQAYLASITAPGMTCETHGISPPDQYLHPFTEFRCAATVIRQAQQAGYAGFIIGHFQEPGLHECKATVGIPVLGLGEATMLYACLLGRKIGLVTINPVFIPWHEDQVVRYGLQQRVVGVRVVDTTVRDYLQAFEDPTAYADVRAQFVHQVEPLLAMGVEVIIPAGGLPMLLFAREHDFRIGGAPALNGIALVTKMAELAITLQRLNGTAVSRAAWFAQAPPEAVQEFLHSQ